MNEKYDRLIYDKKYEIEKYERNISDIERKIREKKNLFNQILRILEKNAQELAVASATGCVRGASGGASGCVVVAIKDTLTESILNVMQNYKEEKEKIKNEISVLRSDEIIAEDMLKYLKHQKEKLEREKKSNNF